MTKIVDYFSEIADPREAHKCKHLLSDILLIGLFTYLSNGHDYEDMDWASPHFLALPKVRNFQKYYFFHRAFHFTTGHTGVFLGQHFEKCRLTRQ